MTTIRHAHLSPTCGIPTKYQIEVKFDCDTLAEAASFLALLSAADLNAQPFALPTPKVAEQARTAEAPVVAEAAPQGAAPEPAPAEKPRKPRAKAEPAPEVVTEPAPEVVTATAPNSVVIKYAEPEASQPPTPEVVAEAPAPEPVPEPPAAEAVPEPAVSEPEPAAEAAPQPEPTPEPVQEAAPTPQQAAVALDPPPPDTAVRPARPAPVFTGDPLADPRLEGLQVPWGGRLLPMLRMLQTAGFTRVEAEAAANAAAAKGLLNPNVMSNNLAAMLNIQLNVVYPEG